MDIEKTLFAAADKMRGAMDAGEYKHVALGLLFLRYVSVAFERKFAEFQADDLADENDPEEYLAESVFWVPEEARWSYLAGIAKSPEIGVKVDDAMRAIWPRSLLCSTLIASISSKTLSSRSCTTTAPTVSLNTRTAEG